MILTVVKSVVKVMDRWEMFSNILAKHKWNRPHHIVNSIQQKLKIRRMEPTLENCRDFWMGYIRRYVDFHGKEYWMNPRKNKGMMKILRRGRNEGRRKGHTRKLDFKHKKKKFGKLRGRK